MATDLRKLKEEIDAFKRYRLHMKYGYKMRRTSESNITTISELFELANEYGTTSEKRIRVPSNLFFIDKECFEEIVSNCGRNPYSNWIVEILNVAKYQNSSCSYIKMVINTFLKQSKPEDWASLIKDFSYLNNEISHILFSEMSEMYSFSEIINLFSEEIVTRFIAFRAENTVAIEDFKKDLIEAIRKEKVVESMLVYLLSYRMFRLDRYIYSSNVDKIEAVLNMLEMDSAVIKAFSDYGKNDKKRNAYYKRLTTVEKKLWNKEHILPENLSVSLEDLLEKEIALNEEDLEILEDDFPAVRLSKMQRKYERYMEEWN